MSNLIRESRPSLEIYMSGIIAVLLTQTGLVRKPQRPRLDCESQIRSPFCDDPSVKQAKVLQRDSAFGWPSVIRGTGRLDVSWNFERQRFSISSQMRSPKAQATINLSAQHPVNIQINSRVFLDDSYRPAQYPGRDA
ncbi:hypothetical protein BJX62DRAFT_194123 [Aspergillus germanicus]